jgi:hypothetical protein
MGIALKTASSRKKMRTTLSILILSYKCSYTCNCLYFSSSLALHSRVGLVWSFRNGVVASHQTPNLEDQGLHFVWLQPFDLSGMGDPTRSLLSHQHSCPDHWGAQTSSPQQGGSPRGRLYVLESG